MKLKPILLIFVLLFATSCSSQDSAHFHFGPGAEMEDNSEGIDS